jgi:hypothetical protein
MTNSRKTTKAKADETKEAAAEYIEYISKYVDGINVILSCLRDIADGKNPDEKEGVQATFIAANGLMHLLDMCPFRLMPYALDVDVPYQEGPETFLVRVTQTWYYMMMLMAASKWSEKYKRPAEEWRHVQVILAEVEKILKKSAESQSEEDIKMPNDLWGQMKQVPKEELEALFEKYGVEE